MQTAPVISPVNTEARKNLGIRPGDTVRVMQKIQEKGKTRLQAFEGLVLFMKHGTEAGGTFTVRKVASGVGVEKTYPLYSPMIDQIEIVKRTKVRQAKLYYIRDKAAKEIRRSMRNAFAVGDTIESDIAEKERVVKEAEAIETARVEEEKRVADEKAAEEAKIAEEATKNAEAEAPAVEEVKAEEVTEETPTPEATPAEEEPKKD
ncbi:MAG: 50S ribosomal protein L19 [Candidatus Pacebacteria bacterium]|nr:50S ribosomal protein L19 [Candidatus Paceibacterota bacterium]